jgi:hypothetical protein
MVVQAGRRADGLPERADQRDGVLRERAAVRLHRVARKAGVEKAASRRRAAGRLLASADHPRGLLQAARGGAPRVSGLAVAARDQGEPRTVLPRPEAATISRAVARTPEQAPERGAARTLLARAWWPAAHRPSSAASDWRGFPSPDRSASGTRTASTSGRLRRPLSRATDRRGFHHRAAAPASASARGPRGPSRRARIRRARACRCRQGGCPVSDRAPARAPRSRSRRW